MCLRTCVRACMNESLGFVVVRYLLVSLLACFFGLRYLMDVEYSMEKPLAAHGHRYVS